ncbi:MAG: hypothetical protein AAGD22_09445 [Verrucomicrobiota bacterium]
MADQIPNKKQIEQTEKTGELLEAFDAGRLNAAELKQALMDIGYLESIADETVAIASGGDDVVTTKEKTDE